jgi:hypothetical protein
MAEIRFELTSGPVIFDNLTDQELHDMVLELTGWFERLPGAWLAVTSSEGTSDVWIPASTPITAMWDGPSLLGEPDDGRVRHLARVVPISGEVEH